MVAECSTKRMVEQVAKISSLVIMFNIQIRLTCNECSSNNDERIVKRICVYQKRTILKRKMSIEALIFEEVVQLLKKVEITSKENLMLSYTGDNPYGWKMFVDNIISWVSKEKGRVILYNDEDELSIVGNRDKKLLMLKHMLNNYNIGHDVVILV